MTTVQHYGLQLCYWIGMHDLHLIEITLLFYNNSALDVLWFSVFVLLMSIIYFTIIDFLNKITYFLKK